MIGDLLASFVVGAIVEPFTDRATRRATRARIARLQRGGILLGAVHAVHGDLPRFGDMWLSSEWQVSPGRVHLGSTTVVVESVDDAARPGTSGDFMMPPGMDAVVLTLRGPGPLVEIAMAAESEAWFRAAVAPRP
ncbi:hypothetical protein QQX09_02270 [Demequina sp. SYSU T00192]|uniref:Uncharacterized protein n=1 Tax=Demequina litoralis TaxID=3051660 RepID=A0ABT8G6A5_9MICO|nr:hypothetical protein [Demequina sp. SYSU T00192]MDN4474674.1 hypothetical protein [Demequina sp. SYSU T00192]